MLCHFILELLFKINIILLQCKTVGMMEEKMLTFFSGNKHILVQTAASIVLYEGFFAFSSSF